MKKIVLITMDDVHLEGRTPESHTNFAKQVNDSIRKQKQLGNIPIVICAGDIGEGLAGVKWASLFECDVIYICGNHEFWRQDYYDLVPHIRDFCKNHPHIKFLHNETCDLYGYRFIGSTLWTALGKNFNWENYNFAVKFHAAMGDFKRITAKKWYDSMDNIVALNEFLTSNGIEEEKIQHIIQEKLFNPLIEQYENQVSVDFINNQLHQSLSDDKLDKTILITHHLPCTEPWIRKMNMNEQAIKKSKFTMNKEHIFYGAAKGEIDLSEDLLRLSFYANDLDKVIKNNSPLLALHGHLHNEIEDMVGSTKIISSPVGYYQQRKEMFFKEIILEKRIVVLASHLKNEIEKFSWADAIINDLKSFEKTISQIETSISIGTMTSNDFKPWLEMFKKNHQFNLENLNKQILYWMIPFAYYFKRHDEILDENDIEGVLQKSSLLNLIQLDGNKKIAKFKMPSLLTGNVTDLSFFPEEKYKNMDKENNISGHYKNWLKQIQIIQIEINQCKKVLQEFADSLIK